MKPPGEDARRARRDLLGYGQCYPLLLTSYRAYTASFSFLAGRKAIFLLALILIASPVAGFRPILAARFRTWRMPRPVRRILSPFLRCRVANVTKSPRTASACFFGRSWLSDKPAARCFSVMVACYRSFGRGGGLLGCGGSFIRGWHDDLLGSWANLLDRVGFEQSFNTRDRQRPECLLATVADNGTGDVGQRACG